jgi:hypothetical protein
VGRRFDFPGSWPSLLADLTQAAAWDAPTSVAGKERALFVLKNVAQSLRGKRFVVEAPKGDGQLTSIGASFSATLHLYGLAWCQFNDHERSRPSSFLDAGD